MKMFEDTCDKQRCKDLHCDRNDPSCGQNCQDLQIIGHLTPRGNVPINEQHDQKNVKLIDNNYRNSTDRNGTPKAHPAMTYKNPQPILLDLSNITPDVGATQYANSQAQQQIIDNETKDYTKGANSNKK